tara:strand:+ start:2343 stop:2864 length:522 start_codon:yes stop_codon:yes gene_type:complete
MVIQDNSFLTREHKYHIDNVILGKYFPWYFQPDSQEPNGEKPYFGHAVLQRPDLREPGEHFKSSHGEFCVDVLNNFCKNNNIKYKEIYRINFNLDINNGYDICNIHEDHTFAHNQLLVYLNNCDSSLCTVIKNKDKEIKIKPEKFKGISFPKNLHYHYFPKQGRRVVLVMTYK